LPGYYAKLVKQGGQFGIACPGLAREFNERLPDKLKPYWDSTTYNTFYVFHSAEWWYNLWQKTGLVDVTYAGNVPDGKAPWRLTADYELLDADAEDCLTLILMTAVKK